MYMKYSGSTETQKVDSYTKVAQLRKELTEESHKACIGDDFPSDTQFEYSAVINDAKDKITVIAKYVFYDSAEESTITLVVENILTKRKS